MARTTNANSLRDSFALSPYFSSGLINFIVYIKYSLENYYNTEELLVKGMGTPSLTWINNSIVIHVDLYDLNGSDTEKLNSDPHFLPLLLFSRKLTTSPYFPTNLPITLLYTIKSLSDITATVIVNYFKFRAEQNVPALEIVAAVHKLLSSVDGLNGYRLEITGRYARQQRATKLVLKRGLVALSSLASPILFHQDFLLLKHGKCGLKVWLNKDPLFNTKSVVYTIST